MSIQSPAKTRSGGGRNGGREKEGGKEVVGIYVCMHERRVRAGREMREEQRKG